MRFVAVDELKPGMIVGRKIINKRRNAMIEKGITLNEKKIEHLISNGYLGAYIVDDFSEIKIIKANEKIKIKKGWRFFSLINIFYIQMLHFPKNDFNFSKTSTCSSWFNFIIFFIILSIIFAPS